MIILALTFTFAFVIGDLDNPSHHNVWMLTIAILVNLIATGLKLGDRSQVGALLMASSLVANVLLIAALGLVVGALIIGVLNNGLDLLRVNPDWQQVIKGVLIVGAVLLDKQRHR